MAALGLGLPVGACVDGLAADIAVISKPRAPSRMRAK